MRQKKQLPVTPNADVPAKKGSAPYVKYYLIAYNALSALLWAYILLALLAHLFGLSGTVGRSTAQEQIQQQAQSARTRLASYFSKLPLPLSLSSKVSPITSAQRGATARVKEALVRPLLRRAASTYEKIGPETTLVQSLAALEVVHAMMGWVRSPVGTTAAQVASRLFLVWGIGERFEAARTSPLYASMVLAWSLTEVIRYTFYAISLLSSLSPSSSQTPSSSVPYPLLWLRYTTFFVLYPLGASSEAFVNYATLPTTTPFARPWSGAWTTYDYLRGLLFLVWWPGLYVMYRYMMGQRRKILWSGASAGTKLGEKPKSL